MDYERIVFYSKKLNLYVVEDKQSFNLSVHYLNGNPPIEVG